MKVVVFGAGQLAQMMYLASAPLGVEVQAIDVKTEKVVHPVSKLPLDLSLEDAFEEAKVITAEFEHVPEHLLKIADSTGKLFPSQKAILCGADRIREKHLLDSAVVKNAPYIIVDDITKLNGCIDRLGDKIIFKASRDGYDGYGQWRIKRSDELPKITKAFSELDLKTVPVIAEKMIDFDRELSIVGARKANGEISIYNLAENLHYKGQLHISISPAPNVSNALFDKAEQIFRKLADELNYIGVLAVEMFQTGDELLVNEIAPRVHNSGHWTQNGAETCQFEQHIRAILDFPLGDAKTNRPTVMVNVIGCSSFSRDLISIPGCHLHWYSKTLRPKRKMGHINITADSYAELGLKLAQLKTFLPLDYFPKLQSQIRRLKQETT